MVTKEFDVQKKCCFYASDFHLEMILLPYIKNEIDNSDFIIVTQNDLSETIKILLDKVNIDNEYKQRILNLNWKNTDLDEYQNINNIIDENKKTNIIINGEYSFVQSVNSKLEILKNYNIHIIDCFCIDDEQVKIDDIKNNYDEFINTTRM